MVSMEVKGKLSKIINIGIYIVFALLMVIVIYGKKNYHTDEISTYILSNNTHDEYINVKPEDGYRYDAPEELWLKTMTVSEENRFDYKNVWEKQKLDVHPPVYYALVHTISSCFPGKFSKWYAGAVNIIFALLALYVSRKISKILTNSDAITFTVSAFMCISVGVLSAVTFLRMYIMTMFWITLITYLFLKRVRQQSMGNMICIYIVSVLGTLTHYYFLIYLFSVCLVYGIWLLIKNYWKELGIFLATMLVAGITTLVLFPPIIDHSIGGGYRGAETIDSFLNVNLGLILKKLQWSYDIISQQLFGGMFIVYILIFVFFSIINVKNITIEWLIVTVPSVMYYLLITKMTPMVTDRYFHPIYSMLITINVIMICCTVKKCLKKQYAYILLCIFLIFTSVKEFKNNWFYLYRHSQNLIDYAMEHSDMDCMYIYNSAYEINPSFLEVSQYNSVTYISYENIDILNNVEINTDNGIIVCVNSELDEETIAEYIMKKWPKLTYYQKIGEHGFSATYVFV